MPEERLTEDQLIAKAEAAYAAEQAKQPSPTTAVASPPPTENPSQVSAPEPAPSSQSAAEPPVEDRYSDVLNYLRESGEPSLAAKYKTGQDALAGLIHAQKLVGQRDEYAQLGKYLAERPDEVFQRLREQYEVTAAAEPQAPAAKSNETAKELDPLLLTYVTRDPNTGEFVDLPGAPKGSADKVNSYLHGYIDDQRRRLRNPLQDPQIQEHIDRNYVRREEFSGFMESLSRNQATVDAQQTVSRLASKIFVNGNPHDGRTLWGNIFVTKLQEAEDLGVGSNARTPVERYRLQNEYAERQAELMNSVAAASARNPRQPVAATSPKTNAPAPKAEMPPESFRDETGHYRLDAMMEHNIRRALERGEITQQEVDRMAMIG